MTLSILNHIIFIISVENKLNKFVELQLISLYIINKLIHLVPIQFINKYRLQR